MVKLENLDLENPRIKNIKNIMLKFYNENRHLPNYPNDYCNFSSKLIKILQGQGISCSAMFSYQEEKDGHTFIMTDDGYIIDPTYGQYEPEYIALGGFLGKTFPNKTLQKNIMNGEAYMKKQLERYSPKSKPNLIATLS